MQKTIFIFSFFSSLNLFGQLPPEIPKKLINKVFCGTASTSTPDNSMFGKSWLDFPYKLTISEDGIFAEFNPKEKWKENAWGKTQTITNLVEWKRETSLDQYGDLYGHTIYYKIPYSNEKYGISDINIWVPADKSFDNQISVKVYVSTYKETTLPAYERLICETLKSKEEIKKEEEERIKKENQQKETDKITLGKINKFLEQNLEKEAADEYSKLNNANSDVKSIIQTKLDAKFGSETISLSSSTIDEYIKKNMKSLISVNPGNYVINFEKNGYSSNENFPRLYEIPNKDFGKFTVFSKSQAEIKIEIKDSILVSTTYSTSNTKPLFIDKNENFYFKTKIGLPVATITNVLEIDKKLVRINKTYKREKYANGILIDSQEFKTEKTVGIIKKDQ